MLNSFSAAAKGAMGLPVHYPRLSQARIDAINATRRRPLEQPNAIYHWFSDNDAGAGYALSDITHPGLPLTLIFHQ